MVSIAKIMIGSAIRTNVGTSLGSNEANMLAYTTAVFGLLRRRTGVKRGHWSRSYA